MAHPTITHTVDVYRRTRTGYKDAFAEDPILTGLDVSVVPASTDLIAVYGGGETFALSEIYTTEKVELKNGDKLTDGTRTWLVKGAPFNVDNHLMAYTMVVGQEVV